MNGMDEMAESLAFLRRMAAQYFPGLRPADGPGANRPDRLRQGRPDPRRRRSRPCPSRSSSPPATPTPSAPRRSPRASACGPYATWRRCSRRCGVQAVLHRHAAPAARRAGDRGGRGRRPRPGREAAGREPGRLRRHARRGARDRHHARRHQPAAVVRAGPAHEGGDRRRQDRPARSSASSRCIAGATRRITSPTPGAAAGTPKGAACSSTSRPTCSTCSQWLMATRSTRSAATGPT